MAASLIKLHLISLVATRPEQGEIMPYKAQIQLLEELDKYYLAGASSVELDGNKTWVVFTKMTLRGQNGSGRIDVAFYRCIKEPKSVWKGCIDPRTGMGEASSELDDPRTWEELWEEYFPGLRQEPAFPPIPVLAPQTQAGRERLS